MTTECDDGTSLVLLVVSVGVKIDKIFSEIFLDIFALNVFPPNFLSFSEKNN